MSIRVAMLTQNYHPHAGGAERQIKAVCPLLRALGVEPVVLTRRYPGRAPFEIVDGTPVYRLPAPGPKPLAAAVYSAAALDAIRRLRPAVVHAFSLFSPSTTALLARSLFGVPVAVKLLRGGELGEVAVLRRKPFGAQRLARFTRSLDAFVTISREIDAELAACGVGPERRAFVPNGVDTRRYSPASPEERRALRVRLELPEGPIAVYTGRLVPEKRADSLIRLWPAVRAACPTATLLLLGEGPQATAWRALAGAGVLFRGKVDNVEEYLRACDLFVLPSLVEGLSNAQLEAMAAGLPALVTDVGGAGDLIVHGESGWLVPPDDAPALEAALLRLLGDERLRARLAAAGRDRVLRDYTLEEAARRLRDLYARLATARERREARPAAPLADPKRRRS